MVDLKHIEQISALTVCQLRQRCIEFSLVLVPEMSRLEQKSEVWCQVRDATCICFYRGKPSDLQRRVSLIHPGVFVATVYYHIGTPKILVAAPHCQMSGSISSPLG